MVLRERSIFKVNNDGNRFRAILFIVNWFNFSSHITFLNHHVAPCSRYIFFGLHFTANGTGNCYRAQCMPCLRLFIPFFCFLFLIIPTKSKCNHLKWVCSLPPINFGVIRWCLHFCYGLESFSSILLRHDSLC